MASRKRWEFGAVAGLSRERMGGTDELWMGGGMGEVREGGREAFWRGLVPC